MVATSHSHTEACMPPLCRMQQAMFNAMASFAGGPPDEEEMCKCPKCQRIVPAKVSSIGTPPVNMETSCQGYTQVSN